MSSFVWVLVITILGPNPEFKEFPKYQTQNECLQALDSMRQEYLKEKKQIVGTCRLLLK